MTTFYKGFSTQNFLATFGKNMRKSDIDLVKEDLLNHIFTAPGDRVGLPKFGTRIPLMAFEPLDDITKQIILDDITTVINYDPRVKLLAITSIDSPDSNSIMVFVDVQYVEFNVTQTLNISVPVNGS